MVTVNLLTPHRVRALYSGFRACYPQLPIILVDNGSCGPSTIYINDVATRDSNTMAIINERNRGHGPALHQAVSVTKTRLILVLDSDVTVKRCGVVELMSGFFNQAEMFAVTQTGIDAYASPLWCMMFDHVLYDELPRFRHHGTPAGDTLRSARRRGWDIITDASLTDYMEHAGMGTRRLFGGDGASWRPTQQLVDQARTDATD